MYDVTQARILTADATDSLNPAAMIREIETYIDRGIEDCALKGSSEFTYYGILGIIDDRCEGYPITEMSKCGLVNQVVRELTDLYKNAGFDVEVSQGCSCPAGVELPGIKVSWKKYEDFQTKED